MEYIVKIVIAVILMTLYGFLRAFVSVKVGDKSGEVSRRLTLNPKEHLDPIGFILFVILNVGFIKPMRNQVMYSTNRKRDMILIAILPGIILIGICLAAFYLVVFLTSTLNLSPVLLIYANSALVSSIMFFIYNLLPIYPLDGEKILYAVGSPNLKMKMSEYSNIINILFIMLTIMGVLGGVVSVLTSFLYDILI